MRAPVRRAALVGAAGLGLCAALAVLLFPLPSDQTPSTPEADRPQPATPSAAAPDPVWTPIVATSDVRSVTHAPYFGDRVMVRPSPGHTAAQIAQALGGTVRRNTGTSGFAVLNLPDSLGVDEALDELQSLGWVDTAQAVGRTRGAADTLSWHDAQSHHDYLYTHDLHSRQYSGTLNSVTVAVLDTGAAYANDTVDGVTYTQAPSLANVPIRYPYDFVNDDSNAYDDHMHGTHIVSLIAGGGGATVAGTAPNVGIMPIKVLDEHNEGTEFELIEGLHHAIENDADIINMSLTLMPGYTPSRGLQEALQLAEAESVFLIAAAGNDGLDHVNWPGASPFVTAVSASCFDSQLAPYTNRGPEVALTAYGGCMNQDVDGDGRPDGLLAETIVEGDPSQTQLAYWGGTSQAAAITTGIAASLLAEDVQPNELKSALQMSTYWYARDFKNGAGAGLLRADYADYVLDFQDYWPSKTARVSVLPYLVDAGGGEVRPTARISVVDEQGHPYRRATVWVRLRGESEEVRPCQLRHGKCTWQASDSVPTSASAEQGWTVEVAAVVDYDVPLLMEPTLFATDGLELALAALEDDHKTRDLPLGVHWNAGTPAARHTMAESYTWPDSGTGFASSPIATLFSPGWANTAVVTKSIDLDTSGVGFASSPIMGFAQSLKMKFSKSSHSNGTTTVDLLAMDGVGFSSSPLGFDAWDIWTPDGATYDSPTIGFDGQSLGLSSGTLSTGDLGNSALGAFVAAGGWQVQGDQQPSAFMTGSGAIDATPMMVGSCTGDGYEAY